MMHFTWRTAALGIALLGLVGSTGRANAEGAAAEEPKDPTRGGWDSFLDPVRDGEDTVTGWQGKLEEDTKIHIGAGLETYYEFNTNHPSTNINGYRSLDYYNFSPTVGLAQISASRPSEGFIPGFGLKLDFGDDAKRIKSDWNGNGVVKRGDFFEKSNFDAQEVYLQYTLGEEAGPLKGLGIKGGKFVTLLGAEVIEPWANPNFSRSYLFGLAIPFTHTGVLVSYPIFDQLSVTGGAVAGWDNVDDNNDSPSFMGNATWTPHAAFALAVNGIYGPEQNNNIGNKRGIVDVVASIKPCDPITLSLNYDYGFEVNAIGASKDASWQGIAGIISYAITDRISTALRGEWFDDPQGFRSGLSQDLYEATLDLKYLVTQHAFVRLEYRHDESTNKNAFQAGATKAVSGQDTVGVELAYVFN